MDIVVDNVDLKILRMELGKYQTNSYIVICPKTQKSALVDVPAGSQTICKYLKGTELEWIVLTHNHFDHTGGLKSTRAKILACLAVHPADNQKLPVKPDMDLSHGDNLFVGKLKLEVLYTPGHTAGSVCFKVGKYLLAGDTIFPGGPGHTETPEAFQRIIKSIADNILVLPEDTEVLPGHGPATTVRQSREEYAVFASHEHTAGLCGDVLWKES